MARGQLFVSFWDVTLSNLPAGKFVHRELSAAQARKQILAGRKSHSLRGVSGEDLFAPYNKQKRRDHDQLRRVLAKDYSINLSLRDFMLDDEEGYSSLFPLQLMAVEGSEHLMVITCRYTMPKLSKGAALKFDVASDSVTFHLFSAISTERSNKRRSRSTKRGR